MIINGLIWLDTAEASFLLRALTGACLVFVLTAALGIARAFGPPPGVVLDRRTLSVPGGLRGDSVTIPYTDITDLKISQVPSQKFLEIRHRSGKVTVARSMLPSRDDFEALVEAGRVRCLAGRV